MNASQPIALYFITGFLESGKTTLLNHVLDEAAARGKKLGVIINEWGRVNIDAGLIPARDIEIRELNDGQVFCSCLASDFVKALALLAERPLDAVVVETSGMANPFPLKHLLADLQQVTGSQHVYQGMTALIDPENFLELAGVINAVEEQIIASERVIINKIDLAPPESLPPIRDRIKKLNPKAQIVETTQARIDSFFDNAPPPPQTTGFGLAPMVHRQAKGQYPRPGQYVIVARDPVDLDEVQAFMRAILPRALRVKGIVLCQEGAFYVDGVNERVATRPIRALGTESKIVVIPRAEAALSETDVAEAWKAQCRTQAFVS